MSAIISGPMRIPNWDKCHRANEECPEIPRSCGQHHVRTVAAEEHTKHWNGRKLKVKRKTKKRKIGGKRKTERKRNTERKKKRNKGGERKKIPF